MLIGGPIEALGHQAPNVADQDFPSMLIGGPIEAAVRRAAWPPRTSFPSMLIGGPIEASDLRSAPRTTRRLSVDANRRPH